MIFENLKSELVIITKNISTKFKPRGIYDNYFEIITNPFGNCQIFSIAWFEYFLRDCEDKEFVENLNYFSKLERNKKILVIDISNPNLSKLKQYIKHSKLTFKDTIMFVKPYTSTNGSKMNIVQLNLTKIKNK